MTIRNLKSVSKTALLFGLVLTITSPVLGLEIRQEVYQYSPGTVPVIIPAAQHFIISPFVSLYHSPETRPFPAVYFQLNESHVSPEEAARLLNSLRECGYAGPLQVAGHTCSIGNEVQNTTLSQQRADSVASLLRANSYFVVSAQGLGSVTGTEFTKNRRVDVRPAVPTTHNIVHQKKQTGETK